MLDTVVPVSGRPSWTPFRLVSGARASTPPGLDAARRRFEALGMTGWARRATG
jgi:hypothetical protein